MSLVTVLTPNGRRQNVKVTPNTTLLQVLEEVCQKHGFKPENYDIKHHNKVLDVSSIFRFSGLPNNAQLELAEATKQRSESPVVLGLHLESGDRLTGEFVPSESLWHVINTLKPEEAKKYTHPVIIYMRKEIVGKENLEKTTLRSLGLTGGRAMLRFLNKTPEQLKTQLNVSTILSRPTPSTVLENKSDKGEIPSKSPSRPTEPAREPEKAKNASEERRKSPDRSTDLKGKTKDEKTDEEPHSPSKILQDKTVHIVSPKAIPDPVKSVPKQEIKLEAMPSPKPVLESAKSENKKEGASKAILLGERQAVAFDLNNIKPSEFADLPDDFFELTVTDAKMLLRDAQRFNLEVENAPLMTAAQREFEENKKMLALLHNHKKTVLRIKFPDRTVLQGTFSPVETIAAVEKFVTEYLEDPRMKFYLYTTPPKAILKSDARLLESNCVPSAVLYFGLPSQIPAPEHFLRFEVLQKFSTPSAATLTAHESRGLSAERRRAEEISDYEFPPSVPSSSSTEAGPSNRVHSQRSKPPTGADQSKSPPQKVPKWFKPNK